ncbi:MAG: hypothetical protein LQ340_001885 [Diploschistes diacapsis]|nr:MAG: hypothetical protein LQ340_001885 [Diploschistes diacapsis]
MSPSKENDTSNRRICTDSFDNQFTSFQRCLDEQMSCILQSILGLPSALTDPRSWPREESIGKVREGWREHPHDHQGQNLISGEAAVTTFLSESPYSPLNVESDPHLKMFGPLWRQAFADLMDASEGRRLTSSATTLSKSEWRDHYVPRWAKMVEQRAREPCPVPPILGALGVAADAVEHLRAFSRAFADEAGALNSRRDNLDYDRNEEEEARTELDMYERMLGLGSESPSETRDQPTLSAPTAESSREPERAAPSQQTQQPSVISTLTTTERVTMPDGSVRTKKVLKKRFADGSEESNESEEVQAPRNKPSAGILDDTRNRHTTKPPGSTLSEPEDKEKKKGGWFWS